jgi:nicotinamidase-related amidase
MPSDPINPRVCAVLALDYTTKIVERFAAARTEVAGRAAAFVKAARAAGALIVYVIPGRFRADGQPDLVMGPLHGAFDQKEGDALLYKSKMGAFSTTNLDVLLREAGRSTLIIGGIATSGTVLSTTRWAFDCGYKNLVIDDICHDPDPRVHEALTQPVHPDSYLGLWRIAEVTSSADVIRRFGQAGT